MAFTKATRKKAKLRLALSGDKFGCLTTLQYAGRTGNENRSTWDCICECGSKVSVLEKHLRSGHTKSCGCIKANNAMKHGHKRRSGESRTYTSWQSMIQRCCDPSHDNYHLYGGRGIEVCEPWKTFENFLADMGERPLGTTIERDESNGNYEPANCKWATNKQQANNKRSNIVVVAGGASRTLAEWADATGIAYACLYKRIVQLGWAAEKAVSTTSRKAV